MSSIGGNKYHATVVYLGQKKEACLSEMGKQLSTQDPSGRLVSFCNAKAPPSTAQQTRFKAPNKAGADGTRDRRFTPFMAYTFSPHVAMSGASDRPQGATTTPKGHPLHPAQAPSAPPPDMAFTWAAVDQRGNLVAFDAWQETYWLVARIGIGGSAMTWHAHRRKEILVGLQDATVRVYQLDVSHPVAKLKGHASPVHHMTFHPFRSMALTTSVTEVLLWDMEAMRRKRILFGLDRVGIHQAGFTSSGTSIITMLHDDTLVLWSTSNFECQWRVQLSEPNLVHLATSASSFIMPEMLDDREILDLPAMHRRFAVSRDGMYLAASSIRSSSIYVWDVPNQLFLQQLCIPSFDREQHRAQHESLRRHGSVIRRIAFIGATKLLAVLSMEGQFIIIDTQAGKLVFKMPLHVKIYSFTLSHDGHVLSTVSMKQKALATLWYLDPMIRDKHLYVSPSFIEHVDEGADVLPGETDTTPVTGDAEDAKGNPTKSPTKPSSTQHNARDNNRRPSATSPPDPHPQRLGLARLNDPQSVMNQNKLKLYLDRFHTFPTKYRPLVWRFLLRLPENRAAYRALAEKGLHPSWKDQFRKQFPMKSYRMTRCMERLLSALSHWSTIFAELGYLPKLIFPFLHVFAQDTFTSFEVIVSVIVNWCDAWFEYYPHPPLPVLDGVEDLLCCHDRHLYQHFVDNNVTSPVYAWPMLCTLFSEVFSKDDWLRFMDHVFSQPPMFLYAFTAAYLTYHRHTLLHVTDIDDFKFFFHKPNATDLGRVLEKAKHILHATPRHVMPKVLCSGYKPLPDGAYPLFNKYPKFIVNYQRKLRDKIQSDEVDFLLKKKALDDLTELAEDLAADQRLWEKVRDASDNMFEDWMKNVQSEQESHYEKKACLDARQKAQRAKLLDEISRARQSFVENHQRSQQRQRQWLRHANAANQTLIENQVAGAKNDDQFREIEKTWWDRGDELEARKEEWDKNDPFKVDV